MSTSSTADLSSPLSEPDQPQPPRSLSSSFPAASHPFGEDETGQDTNSTTNSDRRGVAHYSLTPPATSVYSARHNLDAPPPQQAAPSTPSPAADQKAKTKRPRKKATAAHGQSDAKEKPTRKRATGARAAAAAPARKKAKAETPAAVADDQIPSHFQLAAAAHAPASANQSPSVPAKPANSANYPIRNHDALTADVCTTTTTTPQRTPQPTPQPPSPAPAPRMSYDPVRSMMVAQKDPAPKVYSTAPPAGASLPELGRSAPSASPAPPSYTTDPPSEPNLDREPLHRHAVSAHPAHDRKVPKEPSASPPDRNFSAAKQATQTKKAGSGAPSNAPSPKPSRGKEQPPPLPQGSGLLSSALFGTTGNDLATSSGQAPNIFVHVKLPNPDNNIINFARLAEEKYGFAALHPRLAAQKERLARVAAAGAALEKSAAGSKLGGTPAADSGDDDLSVDVDRESDNEGDVAMTGVNGGGTAANSGTDRAGTKKRRKKKGEEYDQDDPFVDDSEMAWEAQAAAVKDGFFVYCGPLVPEGEKAAAERTDGVVKRGRGRGRGGGPGSRGGRGAAAATAAASTAAASGNSEGSTGRGGGPGSRGGTTTRKPRVTKAGRATMDREKQDREKMAPLAAKPSGYPAPG